MIGAIKSIDGLRLALVSAVIFAHYFTLRNIDMIFKPELQVLHAVAHLSVQYFFTLSGFLIFRKMLSISQESPRPKLSFYLNRCFKILPLWWLTVLVYFLFYNLSASDALLYSTFFFGFVGYTIFVIPHGWSLFVEEVFYAFFPWIYEKLKSFKFCLVAYGFFYLVSLVWLRYAEAMGVPTEFWYIQFSPLANFHFFFLGFVLHHIVVSAAFQKIQSFLKFRFLELIILVFVGYLILSFRTKFLELGIFISFLVVVSEKTLLNELLSNRYFGIGGKAVYPIYLIHMIVIHECIRVLKGDLLNQLMQSFGKFGFYIEVTYVILFATGIGVLIQRYIEKPVITLGQKISIS